MLTRMPPYYADDKDELFRNIMNKRLDLPKGLSNSCKDFLESLLQKNP